MKVWAGITGEGISLRLLGDDEPQRLEPSPDADQVNPRRHYVYGHFDERGNIFYVGKGVSRRAWDHARHPLWHRYVERHLEGKYSVRILIDDLNPEQAEEIESEWISQESETLVNWINFGRKTDLAALDTYHQARDANRKLIDATRGLEATDPNLAVNNYYQAIENIANYSHIRIEHGLLGDLIEEEKSEFGASGELLALNRLTLCLVRLGRGHEAKAAAEDYFSKYQIDRNLLMAAAISKRIAKATLSKK